jgi:hypothetical protein
MILGQFVSATKQPRGTAPDAELQPGRQFPGGHLPTFDPRGPRAAALAMTAASSRARTAGRTGTRPGQAGSFVRLAGGWPSRRVPRADPDGARRDQAGFQGLEMAIVVSVAAVLEWMQGGFSHNGLPGCPGSWQSRPAAARRGSGHARFPGPGPGPGRGVPCPGPLPPSVSPLSLAEPWRVRWPERGRTRIRSRAGPPSCHGGSSQCGSADVRRRFARSPAKLPPAILRAGGVLPRDHTDPAMPRRCGARGR